MNNFGVIEVAGIATKATPGWAYVPDTGPSIPNLQPANRKRAARNVPGLSFADLTARQETKLRKDLEALGRDNPRDANIPIPPRPGGSRGRSHQTHAVPLASASHEAYDLPNSPEQTHTQRAQNPPVSENVRKPSR